MSQNLETDARCVGCEAGNGVPEANGKARGYYVSGHGGQPMFVAWNVERAAKYASATRRRLSYLRITVPK